MKLRLDQIVADKENISRKKAQALIMAGEVMVEGKSAIKPGQNFDENVKIDIKQKFPYVSRGALKLKEAAKEFKIDFKDKVIADIGSSTGGFTDFALQSGAKKVYAIDTGKGQIDSNLRENPKVVLLENTNIKNVDTLLEKIDFFVVDVSFISLKQVLPVLRKIDPASKVIALIKPQFEAGKNIADKTKGIIKDQKLQLSIVENIGTFAEEIGYKVEGLAESPITGVKGNKEFLIYLI